jgi:hypothetical protein
MPAMPPVVGTVQLAWSRRPGGASRGRSYYVEFFTWMRSPVPAVRRRVSVSRWPCSAPVLSPARSLRPAIAFALPDEDSIPGDGSASVLERPA